jgi:hypothetical protein
MVPADPAREFAAASMAAFDRKGLGRSVVEAIVPPAMFLTL